MCSTTLFIAHNTYFVTCTCCRWILNNNNNKPQGPLWMKVNVKNTKNEMKNKSILFSSSWTKHLHQTWMKIIQIIWENELRKLTVCMSVDSALTTRTKTSASRQNLSIQPSKSGDISTPGLPTKQRWTTSYLKFVSVWNIA